MILSDMESLRRKLDFLLLMHTEGSGKLNISMQLVATSLDLVLNIFMNAPTTTYSKGTTEKARTENAAPSKMQGWKTRERKTRHQSAGVEKARKCIYIVLIFS